MLLEKISGVDNSGQLLVANIERYKLSQNKEIPLECHMDETFLSACVAGEIYPDIEQLYFLAHGFKTTIPEILSSDISVFDVLKSRLKILFDETFKTPFDGEFYRTYVFIDFLEAYFSMTSYNDLLTTSESPYDYFNTRVEIDWAVDHTEYDDNLLYQVFYLLGNLTNAEQAFVEHWLLEHVLIDFEHFDSIEKTMIEKALSSGRIDEFVFFAMRRLGAEKVW